MKNKKTKNKGFTAIELIIAIFIIALLSAIIIPNLAKFHNGRVLQNTNEDIISLLNEARNDTISSKDSNIYGIHFQTDRAILFTGASYNVSSSNKEIDFDSAVAIPASGGINLNGEISDVVFDRITGETAGYGTIIIRLTSDATQQKTISISKIGIISSN